MMLSVPLQYAKLYSFVHTILPGILLTNNDEHVECNYYALPYENLTDSEIWNWDWDDGSYARNETDQLSCDSWVYDQSMFISTAVSEVKLCFKFITEAVTSIRRIKV